MLYSDNMPDVIHDSLMDRFGAEQAERSNIGPLTVLPAYRIYSRLLKTSYMIGGPGEQMQNGELLALLLLHFGAITSGQFRMLGISTDSRFLYNTAYRSRKGRGLYPIEARYDIGNEKVYVLKPAAYGRICARLPREYLAANRISSMYSRDRCVNQHTVSMLDIAYATVAGGMPPFFWYGYTDMRYGMTVDENIALGALGRNERQAGDGFSPDAIMEFRHGTKNYVFIEQDMSTESREMIEEKNSRYGRYFDGSTEAAVSVLMYNVSLCNRDRHSINAWRFAKDTAAPEREIVGRFLKEADGDLYRAYINMGAMLSEWASGKRRSRKPKHFEAAFISLDSAHKACGKPWSAMRPADYERYIKSRDAETEKRTREERAAQRIRSRIYDIRDTVIRSLDTDGVMLRAVYAGLSIVVTDTEQYRKYKHYMLPMAKGLALAYQDAVYDAVSGLAGGVPHTYRYSPVGVFADSAGRSVLKNRSSAVNRKGAVLADFYLEEISADIGGAVRAAHFINNCGRCGRPTYLILLTAADRDAFGLAERTGLTDAGRGTEVSCRQGLSVLFVNYAEDASKIFMIGRSGEKLYR